MSVPSVIFRILLKVGIQVLVNHFLFCSRHDSLLFLSLFNSSFMFPTSIYIYSAFMVLHLAVLSFDCGFPFIYKFIMNCKNTKEI